jgi:hypothetical protein
MTNIDFKKELKHLYQPSAKEVVRADVPPMEFLMIDGAGDPNTSQEFADAVETLYALSYSLKFMIKKGPAAVDYGVMPLEGLWWSDDMSMFSVEMKNEWKWTLMIMQPRVVTPDLVETVFADVKKKKDPVALPKARYEIFHEGNAAQILHIGPFSEEGPTIDRVHAFIARHGCERTGKHHEIYLSDIRKGDPARWKTVIRQPMA